MKVAIDRTTFAAGEVSPELYSRNDLTRHATALRRCENFVVMLEGGVTRRPGSQFIVPLRNEAQKGRLIPFNYAVGDSYDLVFNGGFIRFVRNGGVVLSGGSPYEIAQPYLEADLPYIRTAQIGNFMFLTCRRPGTLGYPPKHLTRIDHTNWTLVDYAFARGPLDTMNTDTTKEIRAAGGVTPGSVVTLTSSNKPFSAADIGKILRLDTPPDNPVTTWAPNDSNTAADQRQWEENVYEAQGTGNGGVNPPIHTEGTRRDPSAIGWLYLHAGYGFVRITAVASATSATATVLTRIPNGVTGASSVNFTYRWWEGAWSPTKGWPETVRLHQGRLWFTLDDFFWATKSGDFFDFEVDLYPDSGLSGRLTSPDGKRVDIRWQMAAGVLIFGTANMEWTIRGTSNFDAITVETMKAVDEDTNGSGFHDPARVDEGVVFIGKSSDRLHYGRFDKVGESVTFEELSITARHILKGGAAAVAYQRDPNRILWVLLRNGELRGFTMMPKQEVQGWHRHTFQNGIVEEITALPHTSEAYDELHMIVRRTINGATRRYVEILRPFFQPASETAPTALGAWFVDCGLSYAGPAITLVTGLSHLAGQTVRVFCDGAQRPDGVVSVGGQLTINPASGDIVVGLPIASRVRSLDIEDGEQGTKGKQKQSRFILVQRTKSIGGTIRSNDMTPEELDATGAQPYGDPLALSDRPVPVTVESADDLTVVLELLCDNALPFTLTGWTPDLEVAESA